MTKEALEFAVAEAGLALKSEFVPFSQSRNAKEKYLSLNWRVTLQKNGRDLLTTDYMAGCAHCPSYKQGDNTVHRAERVKFECERGRNWMNKPLFPDLLDVVYSLTSDADVLNYGSFEDWATSFGYDVDSRAAEKIYHACLDIALKLRNGLGDDGLAKLQEASQDY